MTCALSMNTSVRFPASQAHQRLTRGTTIVLEADPGGKQGNGSQSTLVKNRPSVDVVAFSVWIPAMTQGSPRMVGNPSLSRLRKGCPSLVLNYATQKFSFRGSPCFTSILVFFVSAKSSIGLPSRTKKFASKPSCRAPILRFGKTALGVASDHIFSSSRLEKTAESFKKSISVSTPDPGLVSLPMASLTPPSFSR